MRFLFILLTLTAAIFAEYKQQPIDINLVNSKTKIIDIRTEPEWVETGLVKGSIPIMFFDEQGNYNIEKFLHQLNAVVKKNEQFALICNSGSRTQMVGRFLGDQLGYRVIDLAGGTIYAKSKNIPFTPYKK